MARREADRDDLYAEATAFVRRVELTLESGGSAVVAGWRRDGVLTIYLAADEMYQFTPAGELRRVLVDDVLFRTQGTTLARLVRHRTPAATELVRHDLSPDELRAFLTTAHSRLQALAIDLAGHRFRVARQEPIDADSSGELIQSLHEILNPAVRLAPSLPTKRK